MKALQYVLWFKIGLTFVAWCVPLLLFPGSVFITLGFPLPEPILFLRLLGMAYWALLVGYIFGLRSARSGHYPPEVVWVGIASNGGAFVLLAVAASLDAWLAWGTFAQIYMWGSMVGTGLVTLGLLAFGPLRKRSSA